MNTRNNKDIDRAYRTLVIIWLILLLSQLTFLGVIFSVKGSVFTIDPALTALGENPAIVLAAAFLGLTNLFVALFIRKRSLEQAVAEQNIWPVQTGLVLGCAICESISIIGVLLALVYSYQYFYFWFALGITGIFIQFPRREHLIAATGHPSVK